MTKRDDDFRDGIDAELAKMVEERTMEEYGDICQRCGEKALLAVELLPVEPICRHVNERGYRLETAGTADGVARFVRVSGDVRE